MLSSHAPMAEANMILDMTDMLLEYYALRLLILLFLFIPSQRVKRKHFESEERTRTLGMSLKS
jgi:hypothetical protein